MVSTKTRLILGGLAGLLLAGCASYPETYYYDDYGSNNYGSTGSRSGDYYYGDSYSGSQRYDAYSSWSPTWSTYYRSVLYPPYSHGYDPWYTPGWYYGTSYHPSARWSVGWSWSSYYDPWGDYYGWYSPRRSRWNDPWYSSWYGYGWNSGYSANHHRNYYYNDYRRDGQRYDFRRRYSSDGTRWNDNSAEDEAQRIARRSGAGGYQPRDSQPRDSGYRARGEPSASDRRWDENSRYGQPSRFGNPQDPDAGVVNRGGQQTSRYGRDDGADLSVGDDGDRYGGGRRSGWIGPAQGDARDRNQSAPQDPDRDQYQPRARQFDSRGVNRGDGSVRETETEYVQGRWNGRDRGSRNEPSVAPESTWSSSQREPVYERPARENRRSAPMREDSQQQYRQVQDYSAAERYHAPQPDRSADRYQSERQESSRYEQPSRNQAPSRDNSPRYEAPSRQETPRNEAPSRDSGQTDSGRDSSARGEIDRFSRDRQHD